MDAAAIGQLLRGELDRNDKYLEFAQGQIEKDHTSSRIWRAKNGLFLKTIAGFWVGKRGSAMAGQPGFLTLKELSAKGDALERPSAVVDFEQFMLSWSAPSRTRPLL